MRRGQDGCRLWEALCKGLEAEESALGPQLPRAHSELPRDLRRRQHDQPSVSERRPDGCGRVA